MNPQSLFIKGRARDLKISLERYGDKTFFEERKNEGYTEVRFGRGSWFHLDLQPEGYQRFFETARVPGLPVEAVRIVAVWIFYHPDGRICSFESIKVNAYGWNMPGPKFTAIFNDRACFNQFLEDLGIELLPEKFQISELIRCNTEPS